MSYVQHDCRDIHADHSVVNDCLSEYYGMFQCIYPHAYGSVHALEYRCYSACRGKAKPSETRYGIEHIQLYITLYYISFSDSQSTFMFFMTKLPLGL